MEKKISIVEKQRMYPLSFSDLGGTAITFVVTGAIIGIGATLNTQLGSGAVAGTTQANVTTAVGTGLNTFGSNMPLLATVVVAVVIIGALVGGFAGLGGSRQ